MGQSKYVLEFAEIKGEERLDWKPIAKGTLDEILTSLIEQLNNGTSEYNQNTDLLRLSVGEEHTYVVPEVLYMDWIKRLGQWHIQMQGQNETLCGMPMLGTNYSRTEFRDDELKPCPNCKMAYITKEGRDYYGTE